MHREIPSAAGFFTNAEPSKPPPDMKAGLTGVKPMLVSLGVLLLGFLFLLPERCAVNVAFLRKDTPEAAELRERVGLAPGFSIAVYASDLPGVRVLRFTEAGDLLASLPEAGSIVLLERDRNGDGWPDGRRELLGGLRRPHGIDVFEDTVYVAETDAVGRVRFDARSGQTVGEYRHIVRDLPAGGNHWSRSVRFGTDGLMYVTVGSSCNVCIEDHPWRAAMLRFRADGSGAEVYATGLRNTVAFDWRRPGAGGPDVLYGADIGRDLLGDDVPPDELNRLERGGFYGWPYAYGDGVPDPDFGARNVDRIAGSLAPVHGFAAHSSPTGMTFLRGRGLPADYRGAALVALHGSWNRTEKQGYEVVSLHFGDDGRIAERKFATGFEVDEDVIGRPSDVSEGPDGAIYISDDFTGS
ncbi:MAG: PQQ-dependent sugar dehydrogenase, partial [Gammaproteobacteria bacterium]